MSDGKLTSHSQDAAAVSISGVLAGPCTRFPTSVRVLQYRHQVAEEAGRVVRGECEVALL